MPFPLGPLALYRVPGGDRELFYVRSPGFAWQSADGKRQHVCVAGTPTDFASFPEWLPLSTTALGDPHKVAEAAVIHDDLYVNAGLHKYDRKTVDGIFLEILREIGVRPWRARLMYWGVRAGGWHSWNRHHKRNNQRDNW